MTRKAKLTKRTIDALAPGPAAYKVHDSEIPGFSLRVYPSGRKAFFYRYRVGGGRAGQIREPRIGDFGRPMTADKARQIAGDWAADVRRGGDPSGQRQALREAPTMNALLGRYLKDHAKKRKKASSAAHDERMIERHLRPEFGSKRVASVTRAQVRAFHARFEKTPYEANRLLALLSKVFSFAAHDLEWIDPAAHPVKGVQRFPEKKRKRYLSQQELARLGEALAKAENSELTDTEGEPVAIGPYAVAAIRLLVLTGARTSEILGLKWNEVNFARGCLELTDSKTGEKEVFLPPAALQVLQSLKRVDDNPHVIVGRRKGSHLVNIKDPWRVIRKAAGLEDVRLHDLRHSFASVGARGGMSLPLIGALLGHREVATTARYSHLSDDPLRAAADAIGKEIADALGVNPAPSKEASE